MYLEATIFMDEKIDLLFLSILINNCKFEENKMK